MRARAFRADAFTFSHVCSAMQVEKRKPDIAYGKERELSNGETGRYCTTCKARPTGDAWARLFDGCTSFSKAFKLRSLQVLSAAAIIR